MQDCFHGHMASHPGERESKYRCQSCNHYWCKACVEQAATTAATREPTGYSLREQAHAAAKFFYGACPNCKTANIVAVTVNAKPRKSEPGSDSASPPQFETYEVEPFDGLSIGFGETEERPVTRNRRDREE